MVASCPSQILIFAAIHFILIFHQYGTSADLIEKQRKPKILSIFNIVRFKNEGCISISTISSTTGTGRRNGTCYTNSQCQDIGGSASGTCASGFGVCCVFLTSLCGSAVSQNCTYIRNPGFPSEFVSGSGCNYIINKTLSGVCTVRLDFESFNILGGTSTVEAVGFQCQDTFTVTGLLSGQQVPTICGFNSGQHIYLNLGSLPRDSATLTFTFNAVTSRANRLWEIKVTQYFCKSNNNPPDGCLQYLTGPEGRFETFNFEANVGHLNNQNYRICIRREAGYCCIKYFPCTNSNSFSLDIRAIIPVSAVDEMCTMDYIQIEGSSAICQVFNNRNRYCGDVLGDNNLSNGPNQPICDCTTPFIVGIHTDNLTDAINVRLSRGLCLTYTQIPCGQFDA